VPIPAPADYHKINSQGKIPSFEGADGYILSECIAIAIYRMYCTALFILRDTKDTSPSIALMNNYYN
jgi:hypothetical protein